MPNTPAKDILSRGENNEIPAVFKACALGERLYAGGARHHREVLPVTNNLATPTYTIKRISYAEVTGGAGGNGEKAVQAKGATVAVNSAAPAADGKSVNFYATEVSGPNAVVELIYITTDPPLGLDGQPALSLASAVPGLY